MQLIEVEHDDPIFLEHTIDPDSESIFLDARTKKRFKQCYYCSERIFQGEDEYVNNSHISCVCLVCRQAYFGDVKRSEDYHKVYVHEMFHL